MFGTDNVFGLYLNLKSDKEILEHFLNEIVKLRNVIPIGKETEFNIALI